MGAKPSGYFRKDNVLGATRNLKAHGGKQASIKGGNSEMLFKGNECCGPATRWTTEKEWTAHSLIKSTAIPMNANSRYSLN